MRCIHCGDIIGAYEPLWLEREDGSLHPSSLLNLDSQAGHGAPRLWHRDCIGADPPPLA